MIPAIRRIDHLVALVRRCLYAAFAVLGLVSASNAHAAIVITDNMSSTTYGYGFLGTPFINVGQTQSVRNATNTAGSPAEFGVDFNTTSSNESFSFLQNQYCVGKCTTYAMTTLVLTLTNTGGDDLMRFDSQITPGHLARQGVNPNASAIFDFSVSQKTGSTTHTLYTANGVANSVETEITTSDGKAFNGLTRSTNGNEWNVLDWSATNLNLLLDPIPVGQSATLTFTSLTRTTTTASTCTDIAVCPGVQVVFGDPRNNGGGAARAALSEAEKVKLSPVIGLLYDAAPVPVDVVYASAPLPPEPPVLPPRTYGAPFVSQVPDAGVPEPQSWMMMVVGFGAIGIALRRRPRHADLRLA